MGLQRHHSIQANRAGKQWYYSIMSIQRKGGQQALLIYPPTAYGWLFEVEWLNSGGWLVGILGPPQQEIIRQSERISSELISRWHHAIPNLLCRGHLYLGLDCAPPFFTTLIIIMFRTFPKNDGHSPNNLDKGTAGGPKIGMEQKATFVKLKVNYNKVGHLARANIREICMEVIFSIQGNRLRG